MDLQKQNQLILNHLDLAEKIAKMKNRNGAKFISLDDLRSVAFYGLVDAARKFVEDRGTFQKYATYRIIGEINDHIREELRGAGRIVSIAKHEDFLVAKESFEGLFEQTIMGLNVDEQRIFRLYYLDKMNLRQIAKCLELHESQVSKVMKDCRERIYRDGFARTSVI